VRWAVNIVILVLAAFFALLSLGHMLQVHKAQELWATGRVTEGTLTAHHGRRKSQLREYSYTYRVDGAELTAERRTIPWKHRELPIGSGLVVRYDPTSPERSITPAELEEQESWANRAFFPLVSIALFAWAIWRIARRRPKPAT
jgi:hypothetical protein